MKWSLTVEEVVELLEAGPAEGRAPGPLTGIADLRKAGPPDLTFLGNERYARYLTECRAGAVLVPAKQTGEPPQGQAWIRVADPSVALGQICAVLEARMRPAAAAGIHPTALVDPGARVEASASVGPYCVVETGAHVGAGTVLESHVRVARSAVIGDQCLLHHGVVVDWGCRVGNRCRLFPGAVLGADGFGFHSDSKGQHRLAQIGIVVLEDDVEIGANTCVDRARFAETRIGQGTRIDNLVQVGHNVTIGRHCIICAGVGISGSTEIGDFVIMAGQVGVGGHLRIGDGVKATGQTGISKDVPPGTILMGTPARARSEELRKQALVGRLPSIIKRLEALEQALCR